MQVIVELPDEIARHLAGKQPDLSRAVLEATAIAAVGDGAISTEKAAEMLGVGRDAMDGILKRAQVNRNGTALDKSKIIARLRAHEPELKAAGIVRLSLFGSVARGEATAQSDVDLVGNFDRTRGLTLFDMAGLELRLAEILGSRVDLSDRRMLKEPVRLRAEREAVLAF